MVICSFMLMACFIVIIMQRASRRFEEKIETITRIQYKHRRQQPLPSAPPHHLALPTIVNSLTSPNTHTPLNPELAGHSASRQKIKNELDQIINQTLSQFKNQKVNRIIFASPLARLGKMHYRNNQLRTIDGSSFPRPYADTERRKSQFEDFMRRSQQRTKLRCEGLGTTHDWLSQSRNITCEQTTETYFTVADQPNDKGCEKTSRRKRARKERRTEMFGRYSPWKDEQQDDDLVWYK